MLEAEPKAGLFDERCYFQGEFARLAGVACRLQGSWEEASRWFDDAEAAYSQTTDSTIGFAHVAYARLALLYHRYEYALVIRSAGSLAELLEGLGMHTRAAKCRLAAAMATKALGRTGEAVILFEELASAHSDAAPGFALHVFSHLADCYKEQGRLLECRASLTKAAQFLEPSGHTIAAVDFRLVYADFLRAIGKHEAAADAFRRSKEDFQALGMQPFAGYAGVLLAETLMILRRPQEAEDEVRWALPLLEHLGMLPEGCVAVALLQEAIAARRLDHDTLRAFRKTLKL
jgi:tetratricopeptide (TPR) repeat protein